MTETKVLIRYILEVGIPLRVHKYEVKDTGGVTLVLLRYIPHILEGMTEKEIMREEENEPPFKLFKKANLDKINKQDSHFGILNYFKKYTLIDTDDTRKEFIESCIQNSELSIVRIKKFFEEYEIEIIEKLKLYK